MRDERPGGRWLLLIALVVVGLNLRGPIVAVSPVLEDIRADLAIAPTSAGLLTTIPVLCFAAVSPFVAFLARRLGVNAAVAVSLMVLTVAVAVRPWAGFGLMLAATVLLGAAIAVGNVLLPVIVRRDFPRRPGPALSASTTSLIVSAAIPALLTAPLAALMGWRAALAVWAGLVVVALLLWWATHMSPRYPISVPVHQGGGPGDAQLPATPTSNRAVWRSPAAWGLGLYFGLQSLLFYATTAWLPTMLRDSGLDATAAGSALSLVQLLGVVGAIVVPVIIRRQDVRYVTAAVLAGLWVILLAGLALAPGAWPLWCVLGGVGQGGSLALGLSLIAMRSSSSDAARNVSAMVQTVGYCLGATGPVLIGGLYAATGDWAMPVSTLITLAVVCGVMGVRAASPRVVS
jgi:CP family cyanate transporter-like MFS transporter